MAKMNYGRANAKARATNEYHAAISENRNLYARSEWTPIWFRGHEGKTIPQFLFSDPDCFFWAMRNKVFKDTHWYQALKVALRMSHMLPPRDNPTDWRFAIKFKGDKFWDFEIVEARFSKNWKAKGHTICTHLDFSLISKPGWDMKIPRERMIAKIKREFFDRDEGRITGSDINAFLSDESNFATNCETFHCPSIERSSSNVRKSSRHG